MKISPVEATHDAVKASELALLKLAQQLRGLQYTDTDAIIRAFREFARSVPFSRVGALCETVARSRASGQPWKMEVLFDQVDFELASFRIGYIDTSDTTAHQVTGARAILCGLAKLCSDEVTRLADGGRLWLHWFESRGASAPAGNWRHQVNREDGILIC